MELLAWALDNQTKMEKARALYDRGAEKKTAAAPARRAGTAAML